MDFVNKIIGFVIALVLGAILVGGLLAPTVAGIQDTVGNPITKSNSDILHYGEYGSYADESFTMEIVNAEDATSVADTTIYLNGEQVIVRDSFNRHIILDSDNLLVELNTRTNTSHPTIITYLDNGLTTQIESAMQKTVTVEYNKTAGTITVIVTPSGDTEQTIVLDASYVFSISNVQDYCYINSSEYFPQCFITQKDIDNNTSGVISLYTTNIELDGETVYLKIVSDIDGVKVFNPVASGQSPTDKEITAKLNFSGLHIADGTTDILTGGTVTFSIYVDGEYHSDVTPTRYYIINEVSGHETAGPAYVMFGVIVLLGIVMLVVIAANGIRNKY